jgi:predicted AAA+ superfamily ATPase
VLKTIWPIQWISHQGHEVDIIIGNEIAIGIKATKRVNSKHLKGLKALAQENIFKKYLLISQDPIEQIMDNCHCIHWSDFLKKLWADDIVK